MERTARPAFSTPRVADRAEPRPARAPALAALLGLACLVLTSCRGRGGEAVPFASPRPRIDGVDSGTKVSPEWVGAVGKPYRDLRRHTSTPIGEVSGIDVSPDGGALLYASNQDGPVPNLYLKREGAAGVVRKTSGPARDIQPRFSPDGRSIAFSSDRDGNFDIWIIPVEGSGGAEQVTSSPDDEVHPSWSPDGSKLAYCRLSPAHGWSIWVLDRKDGTAVELGPGMSPEWSPTGDWIAFQKPSDREPRWFGIWTIRPDASEVRQLAAGDSFGAVEPTWSPAGDLLAFTAVQAAQGLARRTPGGRIWVVEMAHGRIFRVTEGPGSDGSPVFGLGGRLYFVSDRLDGRAIWSLLPPEVEG